MSKDDQDFCPISGDQHRYFIFKTVEVFEPVVVTPKVAEVYLPIGDVYEKKEYAILGCNCGSVIKREVGKS